MSISVDGAPVTMSDGQRLPYAKNVVLTRGTHTTHPVAPGVNVHTSTTIFTMDVDGFRIQDRSPGRKP